MIDVKELRRLAESDEGYLFKGPTVINLLDALEAADEMFEEACDDPAYAEKFWEAHAKYRKLRGFE